MPLMRRRPLLRAAMVGGTAYAAGKHVERHRAADRPPRRAQGRRWRLTAVETSDLSGAEAAELGALTGALIGLDGTGEDATNGAAGLLHDEVWFVADAIPPGTSAAGLGAHLPAAGAS